MLTFSLGLAQRTHVFSVGMGTAYYNGDLTDKLNNMLFRPAFTAGYTKYFMPRISGRVGLTIGQIGANDLEANGASRRARNLHFRSVIAEASGVLVYEFRRDHNFGNEWVSEPFLTPYIFAGIAFFYFNPKARLDDEWVPLQPLGTEGQYIPGNQPGPYSRLQACAPIGGGLNFRISENTGVAVEVGLRATMTDYLDDVSTVYPDFDALAQHSGQTAVTLSSRSPEGNLPGQIRGNPGVNDYYFFGSFSLTYFLSRYASRGH